jgi:hypothetical protein
LLAPFVGRGHDGRVRHHEAPDTARAGSRTISATSAPVVQASGDSRTRTALIFSTGYGHPLTFRVAAPATSVLSMEPNRLRSFRRVTIPQKCYGRWSPSMDFAWPAGSVCSYHGRPVPAPLTVPPQAAPPRRSRANWHSSGGRRNPDHQPKGAKPAPKRDDHLEVSTQQFFSPDSSSYPHPLTNSRRHQRAHP